MEAAGQAGCKSVNGREPRNTEILKSFVTALILLLLTAAGTKKDTGIDRKALVLRHTITIKRADNLSSLSLGNGGFAFTADITGLQTFPQYYEQGVPLGTESYWGWH